MLEGEKFIETQERLDEIVRVFFSLTKVPNLIMIWVCNGVNGEFCRPYKSLMENFAAHINPTRPERLVSTIAHKRYLV
jgi:hypothetical protein